MNNQLSTALRTGQDFLAEAEEIAGRLAVELANLADVSDGAELDPELLNTIFRDAHSIKGLAGVFGYAGINSLAHQMESLLDLLRLGRIRFDLQGMRLLFEAHALLDLLLRDISGTGQLGHDDELAAYVGRISEYLRQADRTDSSLTDPDQFGVYRELVSTLTEYERHRLRSTIEQGKHLYVVRADYDISTFDGELTKLSNTLRGNGEVISTLPSTSSEGNDRIGFDILFGSQQDLNTIRGVIEDPGIHIEYLSGPLTGAIGTNPLLSRPSAPCLDDTTSHEPERLTDGGSGHAGTPSTLTTGGGSSVKSLSRTVRVDIARLDELMHSVAELNLSHASINGMANSLRQQGFVRMALELGRNARLLERRISTLREKVVEIRLIPMAVLYDRLSLIVRNISREQEKKVSLRLSGAETELDKLIMEDLSDPLAHIVRNAIDHGIELPDQRRELGKDEQGTIAISSRQRGSHVVIEVEDDGHGIDLDRIRTIALQRGYASQIDHLSDRELTEFIFRPGFSTSSTVSDLSGRGVGMDVVRNNISALSGTIDVESRSGRGTLVRITIPITLAIIKTMIISRANRTYALPVAPVHESLLVARDEVFRIEQTEVVRLRDSVLPLFRLEDFFGIDNSGETPEEYYVVVVGIADMRIGLVVDDLLGQRDVIIKPLGDAFKGIPGISGAADLGELGAILVLDVAGMLNETTRSRLRQFF